MNPSDFEKGDRVKYVPNHANGDVFHPDCELGTVSSTNRRFVFVTYKNKTFAEATDPANLVKITATKPPKAKA